MTTLVIRWYFLQEMAVKTPNIVPSFFAEPLFGSCRTLGRDVSEFAAAVFTLSELSTCSPPCAAQLLVLNTSLLCVWICGVRPSCGCNSAPLRGKSEVCQLLSSWLLIESDSATETSHSARKEVRGLLLSRRLGLWYHWSWILSDPFSEQVAAFFWNWEKVYQHFAFCRDSEKKVSSSVLLILDCVRVTLHNLKIPLFILYWPLIASRARCFSSSPLRIDSIYVAQWC